jgi:hypothetical protein
MTTTFTPEMEEQLTRRIIELIHGLPYDEAIEIEYRYNGCLVKDRNGEIIETFVGSKIPLRKITMETKFEILGLPLTIGRVMQAFDNLANVDENTLFNIRKIGDGCAWLWYDDDFIWVWKLTKENGQELTLSDQSNETKLSLYNLFF